MRGIQLTQVRYLTLPKMKPVGGEMEPGFKSLISPKKEWHMIKAIVSIVGALALAAEVSSAQAATYSPPPTWSPMTMLNISFNTTTHKLSVVAQTNTVNLALDTYSNPAVTSGTTAYGRSNYSATSFASFDGSQPWAVLQGKAFSRQLGWNPGSNTSASAIQAAYGADASIWIEAVSHSEGLETYQAVGKWGVNSAGTLDANNVPIIDSAAHGYDPIFGTAGSSTKWKWDYNMDHNANAVANAYLTNLPTTFTANYRIYVGDSAGNDLDAVNAGTETWTWTASVPEPTTFGALGSASLGLLVRRRGAKKA